MQYSAVAISALLLSCAAPRPPAPPQSPETAARVLTGADVLMREGFAPLRGLRIGLLTNHTGTVVTPAGVRSTIDVLHESTSVELVSLFSPEHGIRGDAQPGVKVGSDTDPRTGLPVHSLYDKTNRPTPGMLKGLDALVFDIQDVGARYYTYAWTMTLALRAAAENHVKFVVLDRPDPIGGALVQGDVLDTAFATLVGLYPVPMRYGLTIGELARYINTEYRIGADLTVVPMMGWKRSMWFDETGLPWKAPSPNMPSLESAAHYTGTCLFEGVNVSVGRGTPNAFQQIGAPWIDHVALAGTLRAQRLPGVRIDTVSFTPLNPGDGMYPATLVRGIRYTVTDRNVYDPTTTAIATLVALHTLHADSMRFRAAHFDRLAGTAHVRTQILAGTTARVITAPWAAQTEVFIAKRKPYLLYF
jgi:uncharacterized protein YbbC (DUF1343 family)